jgi:TnpA family transposase
MRRQQLTEAQITALCFLRYPGRPLKAGERPPRPLLLFIAEQIDALPESIEDYLAAERNRQRHVAELQDRLGLSPFGTRPAGGLAFRDETYALALRRLINQQQREPLAAVFGGGSASSSDGQFFRAGGFGREVSSINAHYGDEPLSFLIFLY